jgi:hypothetical protein
LTRLNRKTAFANFLVENYVDCTLDEIEELVAVGVHLSCMRRTLRHSSLSRESALDIGMRATSLSDRLDRSSGSEMNRALGEVDRVFECFCLVLGFHGACSHAIKFNPMLNRP